MTLHWMSDFKYALRGLRRNPVFALVAVFSLALGLGANTAIFNLLDQVMFRPLPVDRPGELVLLSSPGANIGRVEGRDTFSWPMYRDLRDSNAVFSGLAARFPVTVNLRSRTQAEPTPAEVVSGNYFQVFGVKAHLGRLLQPSDDVNPGAHPVVVLSYDYWRNHLGADPNIVGLSVRMNNHPMTVVGVTRAGFFGAERGRNAQVFIPTMMKAWVTPTWDALGDRRSMWLNLIGRLKPGIGIEQAEAGLLTVYRPLLEKQLEEFPVRPSASFSKPFLAKRIELEDGAAGIPTLKREAGAPTLVLMAMVVLVLLIACANVAGLLIARAAARQKEMAVRLAMGAGSGDLFRQTLAESLVLATLGGLASLFVAAWTLDGLQVLLPPPARQGGVDWSLDGRLLGFLFLLTLAAALLSGIGPALRASRENLSTTLKDQGGALASASGALKARRFMVVTQVALSLLLVTATGLFARTLLNLRNVDPGFPVERTLKFSIDVSRAGYPLERTPLINAALEERFAALPGVTAVATAEVPLLEDSDWSSTVRVEGYRHKEDENMNPAFNSVSAGFFGAMGIPVLAGREFGPQDAAGSKPVAVVNETFALYFFGQTNPLGRRFTLAAGGDPIEIIGVVKNSKHVNLRQADRRFVYLAWRQSKDLGGLTVYMKTAMDPAGVAPALRREIGAAAPGTAIGEIMTMEQVVDATLAGEKVVAYLCLLFASLATLLAAVGLFGVMAYSVERRTREIGLRVALGAERGSVIRMVLSEAMKMAVAGALLGLPLFYWLSRLVGAQLYGLAPHDPTTVVLAVIVILAAVALAAFGPAYRASRTDPMTALRYE
jgi:predicted permease